ncbi:MAG: helix-turn-helix transcriptional regulator [Proteobacteria bacterium]|nr:helix-turn-helix transcriptional regulator [Pseudomonadota bacterium]
MAATRKEADLSQRQLAAKLRVTSNWVQRVESLERRVDVAEFIAIARALKVDPLLMLSKAMRASG